MVLLSFLVLVISGLANGLSYDNASSIQNMEANKFVLADDAENKLLRSQIKKDDIDNVVNQVGDKEAVPFRVKVSTYEKKDSSKRLISLFSQANGIHFRTEHCKREKLGTANNEMVADESIKEKGIDIGDTIIDPVSKKEFTIVGFTKDQMFSHTPVVYVNEDVWGAISQPNQKIIVQLHLTQIKRLKCTRN